ncbi:hypothetical protein [Arthrobacter sp. CG_A4]|uniref:hypothetical protein n=1 Tax=Arthrobacter sp. CG_A4 TaxID=3071706 RepID=UPI002DFF2BB4|nr:hypothetical protein [Arthrobacter sp. CG_A4]
MVRRKLHMPMHTTMYDLTDWGRDLETVNTALSPWAVRSPWPPLDADMSPDTLVLEMRAHTRPLAQSARSRRVAPKLTDSRVAPTGSLDALVNSATSAWKTLIISGDPLENCKDIAFEGDGEAVLALLDVTRP